MSTAITELGAVDLSAAIAARTLSCVEVMQAYLARIAQFNPMHNALVSLVEPEQSLAAARDADAALAAGDYRGWMHGMPHAVKDLASVRGLPTSWGSPIFAGTVAAADDLHVARIRARGAIFIGKTNVPEFGLGSQSYNTVFGVTRNAWDQALAAGGSSGGAAVALATGMVPVADGSDMMGSLRNPAAFNNVVGFRPSQGRVPSLPADDVFYQQLAANGPMGRTVSDVIELFLTMAGPDPRAPLSRTDALPERAAFRPRSLTDLRIGWLGDYQGYLAMEPGVLDLCEQSLAVLDGAGARVQACTPAFAMAELWETWLALRHWSVGRYRPLYDEPRHRARLKPEIVWEIERGLDLSAATVAAAGASRSRWYRALSDLFEEHDLLALPSAQVFPFPAQQHWPEEIAGRTMDTYHRWMEVVIGGTLGGLPVISLPVGFDARGRAMGMQFMARQGADRELLEFALAYEEALPFLKSCSA